MQPSFIPKKNFNVLEIDVRRIVWFNNERMINNEYPVCAHNNTAVLLFYCVNIIDPDINISCFDQFGIRLKFFLSL